MSLDNNKQIQEEKLMNKHEEVDVGLSELGTGVYVTELGPYDVLLGRGTGPSSNEGRYSFYFYLPN